MRSLAWLSVAVLLVGCSRDNPAFDGKGDGGSGIGGMSEEGNGPMGGSRGPGGEMTAEDDSADGTSTTPPTTGGPGSNTDSPPPTSVSESETMPPVDTGPTNDCCESTNTPGCNDPGVEACVCEANPDCCSTVWDDRCIEEVDANDCGLDCGTNFESCCGTKSCESGIILSCACVVDDFCCDNWDSHCSFIAIHDCALEGCELPLQSCCAPGGFLEPGCNDLGVALCVCELPGMIDCCTTEWTEACVIAATDFCRGCP